MKNTFKKINDDLEIPEGSIPFCEMENAVIRKRDFLAKQAGIAPEDIHLAAYKLVFVVGTPVTHTNLSAALVCQTCSVKGGYEYTASMVDDPDA